MIVFSCDGYRQVKSILTVLSISYTSKKNFCLLSADIVVESSSNYINILQLARLLEEQKQHWHQWHIFWTFLCDVTTHNLYSITTNFYVTQINTTGFDRKYHIDWFSHVTSRQLDTHHAMIEFESVLRTSTPFVKLPGFQVPTVYSYEGFHLKNDLRHPIVLVPGNYVLRRIFL